MFLNFVTKFTLHISITLIFLVLDCIIWWNLVIPRVGAMLEKDFYLFYLRLFFYSFSCISKKSRHFFSCLFFVITTSQQSCIEKYMYNWFSNLASLSGQYPHNYDEWEYRTWTRDKTHAQINQSYFFNTLKNIFSSKYNLIK